jgi:hypothetical protein
VKHGTGSGRGRHTRAGSPETKRWRALERDLDSVLHLKPEPPKAKKPKRTKPGKPSTPPPRRPVWLGEDTYRGLVELRTKLNAAEAAGGGAR